jgi:hypothetical protein
MVKVVSDSSTAPKKPRKFSTEQKKEIRYLRQHLPLMKVMHDLSPDQCDMLMPFIKTSAHDALCVCVFNALRNYEKFDEDEIGNLQKALTPKVNNYRYLSDKKKTCDHKQLTRRGNILVQSGSGFPAILAAVLPLLAGLFTGK